MVTVGFAPRRSPATHRGLTHDVLVDVVVRVGVVEAVRVSRHALLHCHPRRVLVLKGLPAQGVRMCSMYSSSLRCRAL